MEKNIKNNQSITNEYISKIVKNTDRLVKQLKFLSDVDISFTQLGGSSGQTSSLTGSETIEPDTGNQESNDIKKALMKATYDTLLTNIENIIKYFQENNKDYTSRINSNVNILIDNFRHVHPFENYPNVIPFEKITSLSNIITSLKRELQNEKFKKFINKLEEKKSRNPDLLNVVEQKTESDKKTDLTQKTDLEGRLSEELKELSGTNSNSTITGILNNLTDLQKIKIYGELMDAGIESEIKRQQSLEGKLNVTLNRLDKTNEKILNKYNKK